MSPANIIFEIDSEALNISLMYIRKRKSLWNATNNFNQASVFEKYKLFSIFEISFYPVVCFSINPVVILASKISWFTVSKTLERYINTPSIKLLLSKDFVICSTSSRIGCLVELFVENREQAFLYPNMQ